MFRCYGVALLWCARDVQHRRGYVSLLAAALFVGGIGRLLAVVLVGVPHPFYVAMLVLELVVPPLIVLAARRVAEVATDCDADAKAASCADRHSASVGR